MKSILLKFAGPMQAWGTNSHFENRHTDFYPSKSAVIGMIAASLGYRRDEDDLISELKQIAFAVRVDQHGNLLRDYHTARKDKANGEKDRTYVTNRYYLEDAIFIVAISHADASLMEKIENGLKNPYFQTFMGRRALPLSADFFLGTFDEDVLQSLEKIEWQAADWYKRKYNDMSTLEIYADADIAKEYVKSDVSGDAGIPQNLRSDNIISFSQKNRKFTLRYEAKLEWSIREKSVANVEDSDIEHDVWSSIGD